LLLERFACPSKETAVAGANHSRGQGVAAVASSHDLQRLCSYLLVCRRVPAGMESYPRARRFMAPSLEVHSHAIPPREFARHRVYEERLTGDERRKLLVVLYLSTEAIKSTPADPRPSTLGGLFAGSCAWLSDMTGEDVAARRRSRLLFRGPHTSSPERAAR